MHRVGSSHTIYPGQSTNSDAGEEPWLRAKTPQKASNPAMKPAGKQGLRHRIPGNKPPCHLLTPGDSKKAHSSPTEQFQDGKPPHWCPSRGRLPWAKWAPQMAEGTARSRRKDQKSHQVPTRGPGRRGSSLYGSKAGVFPCPSPSLGLSALPQRPSEGCKERSPRQGGKATAE